MAMHGCDVMIAIGSRFDDRVTGRLDASRPTRRRSTSTSIRRRSTRTSGRHRHRRRRGNVLEDMIAAWASQGEAGSRAPSTPGGSRSTTGGPQLPELHAGLEGHQAAIRDRAALRADPGIATTFHHDRGRPASDVGRAALQLREAQPLDDLRRARHHGLRPAVGDGRAARPSGRAGRRHRRRGLDHDEHPGDVHHRQYQLPVKVFILNNEYMGMVRQWQELLHGSRYSESYSAALPDFVKLAEAFGGVGLRAKARPARRRDQRDDRDAASSSPTFSSTRPRTASR